MKATLAQVQTLQHYRSMSCRHTRIAAHAASRGRACVANNNNRNNASHPRAGD